MDDRYSGGPSGESGLLRTADSAGLLRIVAPNPSPMTGAGTNSYVVGMSDVAVIDPGPDIADHLDALVAAVAGRPCRGVIVTHAHLDHSEGAARLAARLDAPVLGYGAWDAGRSEVMRGLSDLGGGEGVDRTFAPDLLLADGDRTCGEGWTLQAVWTPGHMANHVSLHWPECCATFTGDVVMGWASSLISPPDGDLGQFHASLDRLETLDTRRLHPGHGDPVNDPRARIRDLRAHRLSREIAIVAALTAPARVADIVARIYADIPPALHAAAARNVLAHLIHLTQTGRAFATPAIGPDAIWSRQ